MIHFCGFIYALQENNKVDVTSTDVCKTPSSMKERTHFQCKKKNMPSVAQTNTKRGGVWSKRHVKSQRTPMQYASWRWRLQDVCVQSRA